MNSRELVQQRRMLDNGDTIWEDSQLITAAKEGKLCILDGLERIHWSTAEMLKSLIHHRYLQLPDGSRLVGSTSFDLLAQKTGMNADELNSKYVTILAGFRANGLVSEKCTRSQIVSDSSLLETPKAPTLLRNG